MLVVAGTAGGAGCTVTAAAVALFSARAVPTLLVDLRGDVAAVLGGVDVEWGLDQWLDAEDPPPDALRRIEVPVTDGLAVLAPSSIAASGSIAGRVDLALLAELLLAEDRRVVVDAGPLVTPPDAVTARATTVVAVSRLCHLALDRARHVVADGVVVDGVVTVAEPGRLLTPADAAEALGAPVLARLRWNPAVAAAVDRGAFRRRPPSPLRPLRTLLP